VQFLLLVLALLTVVVGVTTAAAHRCWWRPADSLISGLRDRFLAGRS